VQFVFENFVQEIFLLPGSRILHIKTLFQKMEFRYFFPNFGRPPSNARILVKLYSEMNFSKFWIKNVTRNLPSENYFIKNHFLKIPFYPSNYFFPQLGNWSNPKRIFTIGRFLHQKPWNFDG